MTDIDGRLKMIHFCCGSNDLLPVLSMLISEDTTEKTNDKDGNAEDAVDSSDLSDLHRLLLIRLLRPDRFRIATADYITKHFNFPTDSTTTLSFSHVTEALNSGSSGILVLLPTSTASTESLTVSKVKMTTQPVDNIQTLAKVSSTL